MNLVTCVHRWAIPQGIAPVIGRCKHCGAEKAFSNAFEDCLKSSIGGPRPTNVRSVVIQQIDPAMVSFVAPLTRRIR